MVFYRCITHNSLINRPAHCSICNSAAFQHAKYLADQLPTDMLASLVVDLASIHHSKLTIENLTK